MVTMLSSWVFVSISVINKFSVVFSGSEGPSVVFSDFSASCMTGEAPLNS